MHHCVAINDGDGGDVAAVDAHRRKVVLWAHGGHATGTDTHPWLHSTDSPGEREREEHVYGVGFVIHPRAK